jgi:hypothetical protein
MSLLARLACIAVCVAAAGCAAPRPADCPKFVTDYVVGEATSDFVRSCMGQPVSEDHNPDGRYVYLYDLAPHVKVAFLFDSSGKLIRRQGYQVP